MSIRRSSVRAAMGAVAFATVLGALVPGARAEPVPALHVESLVPARTLAFLSLEEVGSWGRKAKETAWARMAADPEMKPFLDPLIEDLQKMAKGGPGKESPLPPVVMKALEQLGGLQGQVGVALVEMDEKRGPVVAGGLDFGEHLRDFVTFLGRMKEEMGEQAPLHESEAGGRSWWSMGDPQKAALWATTLRTSVLVSTDKSWLETVVASDAAPVADALGGLDAFGRARTSAGGDSLAVFAFANLPEILRSVVSKMGPDQRRVADALGLDTVKAAAYGMSFKGDGFLDTLVVEAPGADHGILPLLKMRPATRKGLALAPSTAFYYEESTFAFSSFLSGVRTILGKVDPDVLGEMEKFLAEAKSATGVDLEQDVLAGLADDFSLYLAMPETGGLYPELVASAAVKDPATFEATATKAVDGLLERVGRGEKVSGRQRTIEWHGKRLHVVDLQAVEGRRVVPFTPTWTMLGDRFVVTLVPHAVKELVLRGEAAEKGLAGEEDFQSVLGAAPEGAGALGYIDLQAVMSLLYDTAVPVLQTAAKPNLIPLPVRLDWAQLPAARSMRPYFRSLGVYETCDGQSLRISIHSPVGLVLPVAVVAAVAIPFAMRGGHGAMVHVGPGSAESATLVAHLQANDLSQKVQAYLAVKGKLPTSLEQMTQEKDPSTNEPFLDRVPLDPWRAPFEYVVQDAAKGAFEIRSAGPDGTPGTPDDIDVVVTASK